MFCTFDLLQANSVVWLDRLSLFCCLGLSSIAADCVDLLLCGALVAIAISPTMRCVNVPFGPFVIRSVLVLRSHNVPFTCGAAMLSLEFLPYMNAYTVCTIRKLRLRVISFCLTAFPALETAFAVTDTRLLTGWRPF